MTHASAHLAVIDTQAAGSDTTRPPHVLQPFECEFNVPSLTQSLFSLRADLISNA